MLHANDDLHDRLLGGSPAAAGRTSRGARRK
jgi:hypothetical protein